MQTLDREWGWWEALKVRQQYDLDECKELHPPEKWPSVEYLDDYGKWWVDQLVKVKEVREVYRLIERLTRLNSHKCTAASEAECYFLAARLLVYFCDLEGALAALYLAADVCVNQPGPQAILRLAQAAVLADLNRPEKARQRWEQGLQKLKSLAQDRTHYNQARVYQELIVQIPAWTGIATPSVSGVKSGQTPAKPQDPSRPKMGKLVMKNLGRLELPHPVEYSVITGEGMSENQLRIPIDQAFVHQVEIGGRMYAVNSLRLSREISLENLKDYHLYYVLGDSMNRRGFEEGDYVLVRAQTVATHGDIVVAEVAGNEDEKYTVKLYKPSGADIRLEADNIDDKYPPIVRKASSGEIRVKGIVVAFLKPI